MTAADRPLLWVNMAEQPRRQMFTSPSRMGDRQRSMISVDKSPQGHRPSTQASPQQPRRSSLVSSLHQRRSSLPATLDVAPQSPERGLTFHLAEKTKSGRTVKDSAKDAQNKNEHFNGNNTYRLETPSSEEEEQRSGLLTPIPEATTWRRPSDRAHNAICKAATGLNEDSSNRARSRSLGTRPSDIPRLIRDRNRTSDALKLVRDSSQAESVSYSRADRQKFLESRVDSLMPKADRPKFVHDKSQTELRPKREGMRKTSENRPDSVLEGRQEIPRLMRDHSKIDSNSDFVEKVNVNGFSVEELRVLIGKNRVHISGQNGKDNLNRVVSIPQHIDPLTVKTAYQRSTIIITGNKSLGNRKWTVGRHGLMTVNQDGSVRVTLDLPDDLDLSKLHVETVTKHYLTVSLGNSRTGNDMLETFELPPHCSNSAIKVKNAGETTVVIELLNPPENGKRM